MAIAKHVCVCVCVCLLTAFAHFGLWECQAPTGSFFQQHRSKLLSSRRFVLFFMSGYPSADILLASYFLVFFFFVYKSSRQRYLCTQAVLPLTSALEFRTGEDLKLN